MFLALKHVDVALRDNFFLFSGRAESGAAFMSHVAVCCSRFREQNSWRFFQSIFLKKVQARKSRKLCVKKIVCLVFFFCALEKISMKNKVGEKIFPELSFSFCAQEAWRKFRGRDRDPQEKEEKNCQYLNDFLTGEDF